MGKSVSGNGPCVKYIIPQKSASIVSIPEGGPTSETGSIPAGAREAECFHVNLIKQVGPMDGGPVKSNRYRCKECSAFLVTKPYTVEVGPTSVNEQAIAIAAKILEVAQLHEDTDEGGKVFMPDEDECGEIVGIARKMV
jgi:hypothetical protein